MWPDFEEIIWWLYGKIWQYVYFQCNCPTSAPLDSSPVLPLTLHLAPSSSAEKSQHKMFTSLSDNEPLLRGQPVRVYHTVELHSPSNWMPDIYVLWLFQQLPGNYPADQSVAQSASCFHPLWQFVSQACCSATDAVGSGPRSVVAAVM